jgi:hypothetical protein
VTRRRHKPRFDELINNSKHNMQTIKPWAVAAGAGLSIACLVGCTSMTNSSGTITKAPFGKTPDGQAVDIYTLRNANGAEARICNYGGIVVSLKVPDKNGKFGDVVLGYDDLDSYVKNNPFFGCIVGRYANRIAKGKFTLNGKEYTLAVNNGPNALHGGLKASTKWCGSQIHREQQRARTGVALPEQGRRGRLSGQSERDGGLHVDRRQWIAPRLRGHDGQGHGYQSFATLLLQPCRQRRRFGPRSDDCRGQIHARGCDNDS